MITNPLVQPKVAILASLLIGALAIGAFMLRPEAGQQPAEQSGFGQRDAASADEPDHPRPTALATGRVSTQNQRDPSVTEVVEAARASLRRNDLASAKVLLGAEQVLYKNDPRIMALQAELEAREEAATPADTVEPTVTSPPPSRSSRFAPRFAERVEHAHSASARIRERTGGHSNYAESGHAPQTEATANSVATRNTPNPVPANPETDLTALRVAPSTSEASSPSQSTALPPPLTQAVQIAPTAPSAPSVQTEPTPAPVASTSTQGPKTRAEVRMEVERARADGALPRFGNPDPAGPGGAPSRISHEVVLNW